MHNYKALKSAGKVSVQKVKVVDKAKVDARAEVKYKDSDDIPEGKEIGDVKVSKLLDQPEVSHEELQMVCKSYDANTGVAQDDRVTRYYLSQVEVKISSCKSDIAKIEAEQAEWEQLETDLKAL